MFMLLIVARKIHCINWEKIWSSREYEGQRVRKIREFNLVLLVSGVGDCILIRVGCGMKCWPLIWGGGRDELEEGGVRCLFGGSTFMILSKVREEGLRVGFMKGCYAKLTMVKIHPFGVIHG